MTLLAFRAVRRAKFAEACEQQYRRPPVNAPEIPDVQIAQQKNNT